MANEKRGERTVEIDGNEYVVRLTINAVCEAEAHLERGAEQMVSEASTKRPTFREVRAYFYEAVRGQHGVQTLRDAGELMRDPETRADIALVVFEALADIFQVKADAEGNA